MSVSINYNCSKDDELSFDELEVGKLYIYSSKYRTGPVLFTKTVHNNLVWFQDDNVGCYTDNPIFYKTKKFVLAPASCVVTIRN